MYNKKDNVVIYAGHDSREIESYRVFYHTLYKYASDPSNIVVYPLIQQVLRNSGLYTRPIDEQASTEFSLTRFLVPHLSGYKGFSLFVDGADMIFTSAVEEILDWADSKYAVQVVKHPEYTPKLAQKMDKMAQPTYPRKNWSSVILFNNEHPKNRKLKDYLNGYKEYYGQSSVDYIEDISPKPPSFFHRFEWLNDEDIGELPVDFNFLCEEYMSREEFEETHRRPPLLIHDTNGCPIYPERVNDCYSHMFFKYWREITGHPHPNEKLRLEPLTEEELK